LFSLLLSICVGDRRTEGWNRPEAAPVSAVFRTIMSMKISARNQLRGTVEAIVLGVVTAKVSVRVGDNLIESVVTRQSVEDLNIKVGSVVTAVIKSTEIMLMVD
jgi:molybdate transport system regulatory protein